MKLTHVLWRKLNPDDRAAADEHLLDTSYEALSSKDYALAQILLDFATETLKRHSTDDVRRRMVVNRAQAYKWGGDAEMAKRILDREDWSAVSDEFRMCVAVLRDEFADAADSMRRIGSAGRPRRNDYRDWPIFQKFRGTPEFLDAYQVVFGEPFSAVVVAGSEEGAKTAPVQLTIVPSVSSGGEPA